MSLLDILEFEAPLSRVEEILQNILGASNEVDPESRVEKLLQNLIEVAYEVDPDSRVELLLDNLLGGHNEVVPMSRVEMLIANALGESYDVVPQSRVEELLVLLAEQYAVEYKTVSGSVVSISDALEAPMKSLKVAIDPVQDLHGYDNPWPAGGGKNKANLETATVRNDGTYGMSVTIDKTAETITMSGTWAGGAASSWRFLNTPDIDTSLSIKAFELTSGSRISSVAQDGAENRLIIQLNGMVSGTAYTISFKLFAYSGTAPTSWTPYSNICPITGLTGAQVVRTGKNLFDVTTYPMQEGYYINRSTGALTQNANFDCTRLIPISSAFEGMTIKWNCEDHGGSNPGLVWYDKDVHYISGQRIFPAIVPVGARYLKFTVKHGQSNIMLYIGDAPTEYEPYTGNAYPISWQSEAGTVYGGTLDVVNGVLTVDKASITLGDFNWDSISSPSSHVFRTNYSSVISPSLPTDGSKKWNAVSDSFTATSWSSISAESNGEFAISALSTNRLVVVDHRFSTTADFLVANKDVEIVYPLAEPIVYHLTPTEVRTLLGQNNVWADTGDVEVTYLAKKH